MCAAHTSERTCVRCGERRVTSSHGRWTQVISRFTTPLASAWALPLPPSHIMASSVQYYPVSILTSLSCSELYVRILSFTVFKFHTIPSPWEKSWDKDYTHHIDFSSKKQIQKTKWLIYTSTAAYSSVERRKTERSERGERKVWQGCERNQTTTFLASSISSSPLLLLLLCHEFYARPARTIARASNSLWQHSRKRGEEGIDKKQSHLPFFDHFGSFTYLRVDFGVCELFARSPFLACFPVQLRVPWISCALCCFVDLGRALILCCFSPSFLSIPWLFAVSDQFAATQSHVWDRYALLLPSVRSPFALSFWFCAPAFGKELAFWHLLALACSHGVQ